MYEVPNHDLCVPDLFTMIGLKWNRRYSPIDILNDDVLLNIFHLYRLADPDEYEDESGTVVSWHRHRWWYKLAHVCRQWRNVILESPSRLDLHLFCTNGVPVADMLAHSPLLPLTIYYNWKITAEDESGLFLALSHRDRVHRVDFWMLPNVGKLVSVMDDQFPILERIHITWTEEVVLPVTFQAPNLRHLKLWTASLPIRSPLLTTSAAALVTLELLNIPASAYFPPSYILTRLSLMAQLEKLSITFESPIPNRDVEKQLRQTLDMTTLPNLRWFMFSGVLTYLEGLVARISTPSLDTIRVYLSNQLSVTVPHLLQFMQTSENLTFSAVQVTFDERIVSLDAVPWKDSPFKSSLGIKCRHLDWQVASAAQLFGTLSPVLSAVEQVTFRYGGHTYSSEWHNNVDRRQWRELLRPFPNAKAIHVQDDLISEIIRSLQSDDGEPPLELIPNLEEVGISGESDARNAFTTFLNERQVAGHPVSLRLVDPSMFNDAYIS
jgi:F-box-like